MPSPVLVLGCGLVGASIAAGLAASGVEVWGADRRDLGPLVERGWLAREVSFEEVGEAAMVVLALPPRGILGALSRLPFRAGQVVTDVASVKEPVVRAAAGLAEGVRFVGGHPMAGGTASGFEAARPDLFEGAAWVLVPAPPGAAGREARASVEAMVRRLGARPVEIEADLHDRVVARTSHLPQLLSTALAAELAELGQDVGREVVEALLGPGGRELLRLARSPYGLWREILGLNGEEVERALEAVAARAGAPVDALAEEFARARRFVAAIDPD